MMTSTRPLIETAALPIRDSMSDKKQRRRGGGSAPYGYRRKYSEITGNFDSYVIVPEEAAIVQRVHQLRNHDQLSMDAIAETLNTEGVPSPRGSRWYRGTIKIIIDSLALYKGGSDANGYSFPAILQDNM